LLGADRSDELRPETGQRHLAGRRQRRQVLLRAPRRICRHQRRAAGRRGRRDRVQRVDGQLAAQPPAPALRVAPEGKRTGQPVPAGEVTLLRENKRGPGGVLSQSGPPKPKRPRCRRGTLCNGDCRRWWSVSKGWFSTPPEGLVLCS